MTPATGVVEELIELLPAAETGILAIVAVIMGEATMITVAVITAIGAVIMADTGRVTTTVMTIHTMEMGIVAATMDIVVTTDTKSLNFDLSGACRAHAAS